MQVADLFASLGLKVDQAAWKKGDALVSGLKKSLGFFVGFEAIKGLTESLKSVIDLGSTLNDTAQKTGLAVEALQEYGYIAQQNSSSLDAFSHGVTKLARGLDEATTKGAGPAYDALQRLKINITDPKWQKATLDDKIAIIAEHLGKLPDGVTKTALAMDLFGKSGAELIPTLNDIAANGGKLRAEFKEMGGEISTKDAASLDELGDNLDKTKAQLSGLKTQVMIALLPTIKEMVESLQAWVKENRELIASGIKAAVQALVIVFQVLGEVVQVVAGIIEFFDEHATLAKATLIALGIVLGALAIEAAAAWIVGFAPVILVIAAIAALLLILDDLFSSIVDGKGVIADVIRWIAERFHDLGQGIKNVFVGIGEFFAGIARAIRDAFVAVFDWIEAKLAWVWDQIQKVGHYVTHPWEIATDAYDFLTGDESANAGVPSPLNAPMTTTASGGTPTAQRYVPDQARASNTQNVSVDTPTTNVTINANGVKADEVIKIAKEQIQEQHDRIWRETHAATGGDDEGD